MKLDKTVKTETVYIALAELFCCLVMQAVYFLLGRYDYTVLLGSLYGGVIAIANFMLLGITVQKATQGEDGELAKKQIKLSYNLRLLGVLVLAGIGAYLPVFNTFAVLLSLVFPRLYYLIIPFFRKELKRPKKKVK